MRPGTWLVIAALLLGPAPLSAAHGPQQEEAPAPQTPEARLQALVERFNAKRDKAYEVYRSARTDEEREAARARIPGEDWAPEFRALAEDVAGTDTAVQAWMWVLRLTKSDPAKAWEVVESLLTNALSSPALIELPGELRYASYVHGEGKVLNALERLLDGSPHDTVRARALLTLGAVRLDSEDARTRAGSRACFQKLVENYGELAYGGKSTYGKVAASYLFECDHLQVGMVAPDFEATDENGVSWKLSDYRGKVVVVDFWGYW